MRAIVVLDADHAEHEVLAFASRVRDPQPGLGRPHDGLVEMFDDRRPVDCEQDGLAELRVAEGRVLGRVHRDRIVDL